jgi:molecular chaperone HscC
MCADGELPMALCGIDLGTTNSLISVFGEDGPRLIPNAHGEVLTPSAVGIGGDGAVLVGKAARERLLTHPDRTIASFKRLMGTAESHKLAKFTFRPEELSALVLRSLKEDAEAHLGKPVTEAIISVPAYFNDHQRKATLDAGRIAGLKVERLVNEPTAAALAYGLGERKEGRFLIFDLGGGTFDVSLLDKYEGVMEVRATAGDTALGGNDFTRAMEDIVLRQAGTAWKDLSRTDQARLRRQAEELKFALTNAHEASYTWSHGNKGVSGQISRAEFDAECAPLLRRLRSPIERTIGDAGLSKHELNAVILVGGATRMPMIRALVARLFGKLPLATVDPDTTVALGAAVQAGLKARAAVLEDVVMTDVCPFTLGIRVNEPLHEAWEERVHPIIERNAIVPVSRSETVQTLGHNQSHIQVDVYQGENIRPEHNVRLGSFKVPVPREPAGKEKVDVRFTYDINGALEVIAKVLSTGVEHARIFRNESGMSDEEIEQRFAALASIKMPPREQAENKALIARAERIYAELRGAARMQLLAMLNEFQVVIARQSERDFESIRRQFSDALDQIERAPQIWD